MSITIGSEKRVQAFPPDMKAAAVVDSLENLVIETLDALGGQIESGNGEANALDLSRNNLATGPVAVTNAEPEDTLVVPIEDIQLPAQSVIITGEAMGVLGDEVHRFKARILPIVEGFVCFVEIRLPVFPMVGVIGVAPESECFPTTTAYRHGGNMDTKEIGRGVAVYLPVFQEGACLALGDAHALMGDGKVCIAACQISSRVAVEISLVKKKRMCWPVVETSTGILIVVSLPTIEEALEEATRQATCFLHKNQNLSLEEAICLRVWQWI